MVGHRIMGNLAIEAMTLDEFIQWQSKQDVRHEYLDGEIVAMTGGSVAHDDVRNNVMAKLREHLRGSPCRAFGSIRRSAAKTPLPPAADLVLCPASG